MPISIGTLIANRYEVVKTLTGGMGLVYLCLDRAEDRPVALKTFQPQYLSNRAARDDFLSEGNTWINLGRHLHVVRAHRVEHIGDGREVYIVLDWVAEAEGKHDASLRAWLVPGKPLPLEQALLFALHIARGMKHAVAKTPGLVHRDLKPENVLVGRDGYARMTDFGLAKAAEAVQGNEGTQGTEVGSSRMQVMPSGIGGTPLYMAPEQWKWGEKLDARTDIYAFGCLLYEMIAGQFLVMGNNLERLHRDGQAAKQAQEMKGEVGELVRHCVAVRRDERYKDWAEVEVAVMEAYRWRMRKEAPGEAAAEVETRVERIARGWSYNAIGNSYDDISKFDVAAGYFERTMKIGQAEKERSLEGVALGNLGGAYFSLGDARRAIEFLERGLGIMREISDRRSEGGVLGNLGGAYFSLGDARRAIGFFEQSLKIAREIGDRRSEGTALGNLGGAYLTLGDAWQAISYHGQHLAIAREIGDRVGEGRALGNLGIAYKRLGDARQAISYHSQHLAIAREIGDRHGEGAALDNLGGAYFNLGDAQRAIEFCQQNLVIAREVGDRRSEAQTLGNLGIAYKNLGNPQRAIEFSEQSLAISRKIGDRRSEAQTLGNLGNAYTDLGDLRRAIEFFEQELTIAREIGDLMGAAQTSYNLALLLPDQGKQIEALGHAEFAAQMFTQAGHAQYAQAAQQLIVQLRGPRR